MVQVNHTTLFCRWAVSETEATKEGYTVGYA